MKEGYRQQDFGQPTKRFVQVMDISDDPALMEEYRKWHSEAYSWKEVRDGIREVGILEMEIYMRPARHPSPTSGMGGIRGQVPKLRRISPQR